VFLALGIQHAMCMRHIAICGLPRSTIFFHFIPQKKKDFRKKKLQNKMFVLIFATTFA
jgi:hypothetical protein